METYSPEMTDFREKDPVLVEIEDSEILNRINGISEDNDTSRLVLRYASLYLNTCLRKTNESEKYELSKISGSLEDLEDEDSEFKAKVRELEQALMGLSDRLEAERADQIAA